MAHNSLAQQAIAHQHGWGLGFYGPKTESGPRKPSVIRSVNPAANCPGFREISSQVATQTCIAHVRRATVGGINASNLHPFQFQHWLMAHNGTIHGFEELRPYLVEQGMVRVPIGTTDSEGLFLFLLAWLQRQGVDLEHADPQALVRGVQSGLAWVEEKTASLGLPTPIINLLLTDGELFLARRSGRELFFATQKKLCRDANTCQEPNKSCLLAQRPGPKVNHLIVASEPIGDEEIWEEVKERELILLDRGLHLYHYHA